MDLELINTFDGADLVLKGNDLGMVQGYENMPYLLMFGGTDFIGNFLLTNKFNSQTYALLKNKPITAALRSQVELAINNDLQPLKDTGAAITVSVTIPAVGRLRIVVNINGKDFIMNWNPDQNQMI